MNPEIFGGLIRALQGEPATGRRLLDASCAAGESSAAYRKLGFEVTASNYDPAEFRVAGMTCLRVDLNEPWPFADGAFDVVVLQEVVEHLENIPFVFREVRRVLQPGGCFIFSTPNMLNWTSRLRFLGTGFYMGRKHPLRVNAPPGNAPNWHILPFHIYHWLGHHYGLKVEKLIGMRQRLHAALLGAVLYPFCALYTYRWWVASQKSSEQRAYNLELWRHLFSRELLWSNTMVVKMRKQGSEERPMEPAPPEGR